MAFYDVCMYVRLTGVESTQFSSIVRLFPVCNATVFRTSQWLANRAADYNVMNKHRTPIHIKLSHYLTRSLSAQ
jgi:hypothetical protein